MIDAGHLLNKVIRPVLKNIGLWSDKAERLVLGTACKESDCGRWLTQLGDGPARGVYQMEPATHDDLWASYIDRRPDLKQKILHWQIQTWRDADQMAGNIYYATAMCRVHYLRIKEALPDTLGGQARYWKQYYNTPLGAGTIDEYISKWRQFVDEKIFKEGT